MLGGRPRPKIRAPRRVGMQGTSGPNFDQEWSGLAASFQHIHEKQASALSYEELYRKAYQLVLRKQGELLYDNVIDFEKTWLTGRIQTAVLSLLSSELTTPPALGGSSFGASVAERCFAGERLLKGVWSEWNDHNICLNMISDVTMYLERVFCADNNKPSLYTAGIQLFRDHVLKASTTSKTSSYTSESQLNTVLAVIVHTMLDQIQMERDGDAIEKSMLKSCTKMLEGIYIAKTETEDQRLYNVCFEPQFMEASRHFYAQESERMLRECDAGTYCRLTKRRLVEEQDRCRSTLSESTRPKIEQIVAEELISNKLKDLIDMDSGVIYMINNDRLEELGLIYELSEKVDPDKKELRLALQDRIAHSGAEVNQAALAVPAVQGLALNQQTASAIQWVEEVLALKDKYDRIIAKSFRGDQKLHTAQTQSFTSYVNASTFNRASEYVSLFIDDNMKKGIKDKSETEIEALLQKAIDLLKYITDKDMFERYYKKHLSRRLLMNKSQSLDVEKQMIGKMKVELGNTFTTKMEVMFKDMTLSDEMTSSFKSVLGSIDTDVLDSDVKPVDLAVHVLTSMTWPQEMVMNALDTDHGLPRILYPPQIERLIHRFNLFYASKHNGRKLTWLPSMGTADIRARFPSQGGKERVHEFNVSTYAMLILWQFNDLPSGATLTTAELQAATNIPSHDLNRNLQSLALNPKTRLLRKEPMSREINDDDKFSFNEGFKSQYYRVKVGVVAAANRVENERERVRTEARNDETRLFVCEAAIVRIMKQRKELSHQMLISETISQLTHFKPEVAMIKSRIENLIEREYLERIEDGSKYRYLA